MCSPDPPAAQTYPGKFEQLVSWVDHMKPHMVAVIRLCFFGHVVFFPL